MVNTALDGEKAAVLNVTVAELLADPEPVAAAIEGALDGRPETGVMGHWMLHELLRRSNLHDGLVNALASPNPLTRTAAARVCAAARIPDSTMWIGDLVTDSNPRVQDVAVRSLGRLGGKRAVDILMESSEEIPLYRLAIELSRAATDVDIEALMRRPVSETAAVATVLASGLRRDRLRITPLLGIAHDRRWPLRVRVAACLSLAAIGDRSAADSLKRLADNDPDEDLKTAAGRAHRRLVKRAVAA